MESTYSREAVHNSVQSDISRLFKVGVVLSNIVSCVQKKAILLNAHEQENCIYGLAYFFDEYLVTVTWIIEFL